MVNKDEVGSRLQHLLTIRIVCRVVMQPKKDSHYVHLVYVPQKDTKDESEDSEDRESVTQAGEIYLLSEDVY